MRSITKDQRAELDKAIAAYRARFEALNLEVSELSTLFEAVEEARETLAGIVCGLADSADCCFDERSERWQESDAGQAYSGWRDSLRTAADAVDAGALEVIEEVDEPDWLQECDDLSDEPD